MAVKSNSILAWFRALFAMVREYRKDRKFVTALMEHDDGRIVAMELESVRSTVWLPEVVARWMTPDEMPTEAKLLAFRLVHTTVSGNRYLALYKAVRK